MLPVKHVIEWTTEFCVKRALVLFLPQFGYFYAL